jgi:hypothetical protein
MGTAASAPTTPYPVTYPVRDVKPPSIISDEEVWLRAWCATIIDEQVLVKGASEAADACLEEFKKRFRVEK